MNECAVAAAAAADDDDDVVDDLNCERAEVFKVLLKKAPFAICKAGIVKAGDVLQQ